MKKELLESVNYWSSVIVIGVIIGLGAQFSQAWVEPVQLPPNGNVSGPLTTGPVSQTKVGGNISLANGGSLYVGDAVGAARFCLGSDCISAWPTGGSGGGDNLGNHTATQNLRMGDREIIFNEGRGVYENNNQDWIALYSESSEIGLLAYADGASQMRYDGNPRIVTTADGGRVAGNLSLSNSGSLWTGGSVHAGSEVRASDRVSAPTFCLNGTCRTSWPTGGGSTADNLGNHTATQNLHMGDNHVIFTEGRGLENNNGSNWIGLVTGGGEVGLISYSNGESQMRHNGVVRVKTTNTGGHVEGELNVTGPASFDGISLTNNISTENGSYMFRASDGDSYLRKDAGDNSFIKLINNNKGFKLNTAGDLVLDGSFSAVGHVSSAQGSVYAKDAFRWTSSGAGAAKITSNSGGGIELYRSGSSSWAFKVGGSGVVKLAGGITVTSDARLKEDVSPLDNSLEKVLQLRGVNYTWKDPSQEQRTQIGFIAQEVEKVIPELVSDDEEDGYKSMNYSQMTAVLVEAMKEQQEMIETQNDLIKNLQRRVEQLER